jgi:hypothetical protein
MTQAAASQQILKIPRSIVLDVTVLNAAVHQPQNLQIPNDADFEWWWLSIFRTVNTLKILMTETGVGNRAFIYSGSPNLNTAFDGILVDNWAGIVQNNGAFPIAVPYVMPANRQYQFQFTDSTGASGSNPIEIALHGYGLLAVAPPSTSGQ